MKMEDEDALCEPLYGDGNLANSHGSGNRYGDDYHSVVLLWLKPLPYTSVELH